MKGDERLLRVVDWHCESVMPFEQLIRSGRIADCGAAWRRE